MVHDRLTRILGIAAASIAVRLWFVFAYRIDSDEPQHLHVAWAWSQGLVQYRDVFDNHLPLLHLLFAPLLGFVSESSSVFSIARLAMLPFALGCAVLVYLIVRRFADANVALVAAIAFNALPPWLPKSVELRNDTLWLFFWLAAVALVVCRPRAAWFGAGVAFGFCLLASIKAVPLLIAHVLVLFIERRPLSIDTVTRFAAGLALPIAAVAGYMAGAGALDEMVYGTLLFNAAAPVSVLRRVGGALAFATVAPVMLWKRPSFSPFTLFAICYALVLLCFWPILTPRDFLPIAPLAAFGVGVVGCRLSVVGQTGPTVSPANRQLPTAHCVAVLLLATLASVWYARLWRPHDRARERFVDSAVALTGPGDFVFDLKGDAVFRRRPVYAIYEDVGRALTANGRLRDSGPERIVANRCCAAMADSTHIPYRTRAFLNRHFVAADGLRVCGTVVRKGSFEIAVPQFYVILAPQPHLLLVDGQPYLGPRLLSAGRHTVSGPGVEGAKVVWWRAAKEAL